MALCDAEDVVQPVKEAFENFMVLQQPVKKQDYIQKLKEQITKARKSRPEGANDDQFVLKKRNRSESTSQLLNQNAKCKIPRNLYICMGIFSEENGTLREGSWRNLGDILQ